MKIKYCFNILGLHGADINGTTPGKGNKILSVKKR